MIGTDQQRLALPGAMFDIVSEPELGRPCNLALIAQDAEVYLERQAPQATTTRTLSSRPNSRSRYGRQV